jgi:hypothetical protein
VSRHTSRMRAPAVQFPCTSPPESVIWQAIRCPLYPDSGRNLDATRTYRSVPATDIGGLQSHYCCCPITTRWSLTSVSAYVVGHHVTLPALEPKRARC